MTVPICMYMSSFMHDNIVPLSLIFQSHIPFSPSKGEKKKERERLINLLQNGLKASKLGTLEVSLYVFI